MVAVTEARDVFGGVAECVEAMLQAGLKKFTGQRWADLNVLVLDADGPNMTPERVRTVVQSFTPEELQPLGLLLVVDKNESTVVYRGNA